MQTGMGFCPVGITKDRSSYRWFYGTLDGENHKIDNIYIDMSSNEKQMNAALISFGVTSTVVKNLEISGNIKNNWHTAGILGGENCKLIQNCKNNVNITGFNMAGGIIANMLSGKAENCVNTGNISITGMAWAYGGVGGIAGTMSNATIENSINKGTFNSEKYNGDSIGGILGVAGSKAIVNHCIVEGTNKNAGGIVGFCRDSSSTLIENSCCLGSYKNGIISNYNGASWDSGVELSIKNCYSIGNNENAGIIGYIGTLAKEMDLNISNCYVSGKNKYAIIGSNSNASGTTKNTVIENTYYDPSTTSNIGAITDGITGITIKNNQDFVNTLNTNASGNEDWSLWKIGDDGYPTFQ